MQATEALGYLLVQPRECQLRKSATKKSQNLKSLHWALEFRRSFCLHYIISHQLNAPTVADSFD